MVVNDNEFEEKINELVMVGMLAYKKRSSNSMTITACVELTKLYASQKDCGVGFTMQWSSVYEKEEFGQHLDYLMATTEYTLTLLTKQGEMGASRVQAQLVLSNQKIDLLQTKIDKLQKNIEILELRLSKLESLSGNDIVELRKEENEDMKVIVHQDVVKDLQQRDAKAKNGDQESILVQPRQQEEKNEEFNLEFGPNHARQFIFFVNSCILSMQ